MKDIQKVKFLSGRLVISLLHNLPPLSELATGNVVVTLLSPSNIQLQAELTELVLSVVGSK